MFRAITKNGLAIDTANKFVSELLSLAKELLESESVRVQKIAAAFEIHEDDYRRLVLAELCAEVFHNLSYTLYVNSEQFKKNAEIYEKLKLNTKNFIDAVIKRDERTFVHPEANINE